MRMRVCESVSAQGRVCAPPSSRAAAWSARRRTIPSRLRPSGGAAPCGFAAKQKRRASAAGTPRTAAGPRRGSPPASDGAGRPSSHARDRRRTCWRVY
eukprot:6175405-Pleurochrysis_carterae.AAC.4